MQALLEVILPVFVVIGAGYAAVRAGLFDEAGVDGAVAAVAADASAPVSVPDEALSRHACVR